MEKRFRNWLKDNYVWILLNFPALVLFVLLFYKPQLRKPLTSYTGYIALGLLVLVLALNPLLALFSRLKLIKKINRYRREIGISVFSYTLVHFFCYFIKRQYNVLKTVKCFISPGIMSAVLATLIFLLLAVTSNNYSVKKLGLVRWKKWHKSVYLAEASVFLHMLLKGNQIYALLIFGVLLLLQILRIRQSQTKEPC